MDFDAREINSCYNMAIQKATGKYIIFEDFACRLEPDTIEKMVSLAEHNTAEIVISEFYNITNNSIKKVYHLPSSLIKKKSTLSLQDQLDLFLLIHPGLFNKLIQLDLIRKNNIALGGEKGYFDYITFLFLCLVYAKHVYLSDDYLFYCHYQIFKQSKKFRSQFICELDFLYRQLKNRRMDKVTKIYSCTIIHFLKDFLNYTSSKHIRDELHLIKENFSTETFYQLFCSNRDFLAYKSVSIIIPVYNAETHLRRCLNSACNQSLKDIEIICIDDGSTDNSLKILREFEQKDNRITVLHQDNQGQSIARNQGMRVAAGEFYQFLDADDFLEHDSCEILFLYSKIFDLQMCFLMAALHNGDEIQKRVRTINFYLEKLSERLPIIFNKNHLGDSILNLCHAPWAIFYSRRFLIDYYIHFPNKRLTYCEDLPFFIISLLKANNISAILAPLYHYCFTTEGATALYHRSPSQLKDLCLTHLYTLNMIYKLGTPHLFNLYANSFSESILKDINQKKTIIK